MQQLDKAGKTEMFYFQTWSYLMTCKWVLLSIGNEQGESFSTEKTSVSLICKLCSLEAVVEESFFFF